MITPKTIELSARAIRLIIAGVVLIALAIGFKVWLSNRDKQLAAEATAAQSQQTGIATEVIGSEAGEALAERDAQTATVIEYRTIVERQQEQLRNEDPEINDWANGIIPVRLRESDREARTANRRSNGEAGSDATGNTANDTRPDPIPR